MTKNDQANRPTCPFCGEVWSDAMIEQYAGMTKDGGCGCCGDPLHEAHDHAEPAEPLPTEDLCCAHCKRALYLSLASFQA